MFKFFYNYITYNLVPYRLPQSRIEWRKKGVSFILPKLSDYFATFYLLIGKISNHYLLNL